MSMSRRFTLLIALLIVVIGALFAMASSYWLWTTERANAVQSVRDILRAEAAPISRYAWNFNLSGIERTVKTIESVTQVEAAWVELTSDGEVTDVVGQPGPGGGDDHLVVPLRLPERGQRLGSLHATLDLAALTARARMLLLVQIGGLALLLGIIALAVRLAFQRLVAAPLERIGAHMSDPDLLSSGPSLRIPGPSSGSADELGRLEAAINTMVQNRRADLVELDNYRERLEELVEERTQQLKSTQDELIRSENLAALGSMVAGIAHELNTPIGNGLMGATTIAERTSEIQAAVDAGTLTRSDFTRYLAETAEGARVIRTTLERAKSLVENFKQVAVDRQSTQRRPFNVNEVLDETVETLQPSLKRTPVTLACDHGAEVVLDSYPGPLGQVITNLVENALKHGLDGVADGRVRIATEPGREALTITVGDTGHGIPDHVQKRMFDPFYTTKRGQGGTGLGMSIVHRMVTELMGGSIQVASTPGEGTTFTITLPYTAPENEPDEPRAAEAA